MTQESKNRLQIRFNWKIALFVALFFSLLMKLGFWQLSRADHKRRMQNVIDARQEAAPQTYRELIVGKQKRSEVFKGVPGWPLYER